MAERRTSLNLYEAIFCRKSVRTYTNDEISPEVFDDFRRHYREIPDLFGGMETDFTILDNRKGQHKLLSLFSVRAPYYMAFYSEEAPRCMMNMGCRMEQMVLYLCSKGYGTCFLASTRISHSLQTKGNMVLVGLIAFGISKGSCYRKKAEAKRLPLEQLCVYRETPREWMRQLLEAARLSPSSMNIQPWRFVVYDSKIHIYTKKHAAEDMSRYRLDELNFGIMFANMMTAAEELWLDLDLIRLEDISQKNYPRSQYVLSAVLKL